ncbi:hypothetical protein C1N71_13205 [Agrococcus sp. SGAir0287]|nr:hypothetical protein C1N71_13205 [Agrococcus sp. SGAir0287]
MDLEVVGGGSSAVASSSHAACARFRGTDPLITGLTRRNLAKAVGFEDASGAIPSARWMRAMTFERLVRNEAFASQVATRTVGALKLERPAAVATVDAHSNVDATASALRDAHERALQDGTATLIFQLAVPFVGYEHTRATDVKPDFAVVARASADSTWLVMGDAKDYERVRSRIDDARLMKGFLQVAVGAASARAWSQLPDSQEVHTFGVLAVPRNAFLQPEPIVENLADYDNEVTLRISERRREAAESGYTPDQSVVDHVRHLEATYDPAACTTCTLFSYCRDELRRSSAPNDLLIELGVPRAVRAQALGLVDGSTPVGAIPASTAANITATLTGHAQSTGQRRVDQAGQPGTVNLVLAKSDGAALGVHGIGIQRIPREGRGEWEYSTFDDPHGPETRRRIMRLLGSALTKAMRELRSLPAPEPQSVHLVVPDAATADLLVSIADNLAGIELSRLRWQRDLDQRRPALTYDGEPATLPRAINETERTAIALLLEDDRARGFSLRAPIIDLRNVLARHLAVGGPATNAGRLDYLAGWSESLDGPALAHRDFADAIEASAHTPGARLTNGISDEIHEALVGRRGKAPESGAADPDGYATLVTSELEYKALTMETALDVLDDFPSSALRIAYRAIEADAQAVWRRRLSLRASDLVRFGRTYRTWRNDLVPMLESDATCTTQMLVVSNPQAAADLAGDAGTRQLAFADVVSTAPLVLDVQSRRIAAGTRVVMIAQGDSATVEGTGVSLDLSLATSIKISGLAIGPLATIDAETPQRLAWAPATPPQLEIGDRIVIADFAWFSPNKGNQHLPISKPKADDRSAPKPDCAEGAFADAPHEHQWCCRPHESRESEFSDELARRRERGELNPQVWPPVVDADAFEVTAVGAAQGDPFAEARVSAPSDQTLDDLE